MGILLDDLRLVIFSRELSQEQALSFDTLLNQWPAQKTPLTLTTLLWNLAIDFINVAVYLG